MRARRSCLAVPGSEVRFHAKANDSQADEILLDLEDAVAPAAKASSRDLVVNALRTYPYAGKTRVVRVNARDTTWCEDDVRVVVEGAGDAIDCLMFPKVESADDVRWADDLLSRLAPKRRIGLELQIESARGLDRVSEIAVASPRIETLILGPGDLAASLGTRSLAIGADSEMLRYALARIVIAARANGLQPIDGPFAGIRDVSGLRESSRRAALLGCDGKWAIHPSQVDVINEVFTPTKSEIDRASAIVSAYAAATGTERQGAVRLGDEMIDEASRKMAEQVLERARLYGMSTAIRD